MSKTELQSAQSQEVGCKLSLPITLVVCGKEYQWDYQFIKGIQIKDLAGLPENAGLYLSVNEPWDDEPVANNDQIDLAREGIEYFYIRQPLKLIVNGQEYEWKHQYISGFELKRLVGRDGLDEAVLLLSKPYEDEVITDTARVDLARPGIEHFRVRKKGEDIKVSIKINDKEYWVKRGKHTVVSLKQLGGVPSADELNEVIAGKLTPLDDNAIVEIKGCEEFFSCKRDGSSS
jgi:hypothetical protein